MSEGVQFTRKSANRIADTVRSVEDRPFPTNGLQRRRGGDKGRSTLYEVTAVQTGPETCTVKRVENQAGDLIDASEKTDILYDTALEPAEGDRGLLIRLGEGSLFFFKPGGIAKRAIFTEYCYLRSATPSTPIGYPNISACTYYSDGNESIGLLKFGTRPAGAFKGSSSKISIGRVFGGVNWKNVPPRTGVTSQIKLYSINEDFDPATITYNDWAGLDTTLLSNGQGWTMLSVLDGTNHAYTTENVTIRIGQSQILTKLGRSNPYGIPSLHDLIFYSAYGVAIRGGWWPGFVPPNGSFIDFAISRDDLTFSSWLEWE